MLEFAMSRAKTILVLSLIAMFGAAPAGAQEAAPEPAAPAGEPIASDELRAITGGQGVHVDLLSHQQLTATSTGNTVTAGSIQSGDVAFSANALQGFSGIGNFVINTGANNNLQGSISVSIVTTPVP